MRTRVAVVVGVCVLSMVSGLFAGPLDRAKISSEANWVAHLDVQKFNESKLAGIVREELAAAGIDKKLDEFKAIFTFHPLNDLKNITLYGRDKDKAAAVVLIQGTFDKERLDQLIQTNPYYRQKKQGAYSLHSWIDEKKNGDENERQYGGFFGKDIAVIGSSAETVARGLDVLGEKAPNARQEGSFRGIGRLGKNAFLVASANGVGKMAEQSEKTMMLKNTEQSSVTVGEAEGNLNIDVGLRATSEKTADELHQVIQGFVALLNLGSKEQPQLAEIASAVQLTKRNNTVGVHFEYDVDKIAKFIKAEWQKKQAQEKAKQQEPSAK